MVGTCQHADHSKVMWPDQHMTLGGPWGIEPQYRN